MLITLLCKSNFSQTNLLEFNFMNKYNTKLIIFIQKTFPKNV